MKTCQRLILLWLITGPCLLFSCRNLDTGQRIELNNYHHRKYGAIRVCYQRKPDTIQSWPCQRGKIRFYENGKLLSFTLSEDHLQNNGLIPAGSRITLYRNGNPEFIRLATDTEIQGHHITGNKRFSDILTEFYGEGGLKQFQAKQDNTIDGIPCSNTSEITLYPDGQLMVCRLSKDLQQGKKSFPAGSKLVILENRAVYNYSPDIHSSIRSRLNMETYISEQVVKAYDLRMNGRISQAYTTIRDLEEKNIVATPMAPFEMGRIKRHRLLGGDPEASAGSVLKSTRWAANWDRHNIIFGFFDADCASFAAYRVAVAGDSISARRYYLRAIDGFEKLLRMKPDHYSARLSLVDLYSRLPEFLGGNMEKAHVHAKEFQNYDNIWAARAESILLPDEARRLEYWIRKKKTCPDDPDVLYELGRACLMNDDILNGDECFRRAMALDSSRIVLLLDLARFHIMKLHGDPGNPGAHPEEAESYLSEYLDTGTIQPVRAWCYAQLAAINESVGKSGIAENYLEEAKKLDQGYLKEDRLPPMMLYYPLNELSADYYSYFDTY